MESLYTACNRRENIGRDPVQFIYRYSDDSDRELSAFFASCLAYGRVEQIGKSLTELFRRIGNGPSEFVRNFNAARSRRLRGFKHRFTTGESLADLMWVLKDVLAEYGSMEKFFLRGYNPADENVIPALSKFCDSLLEACARNNRGRVSRALNFLLPRPDRGSPCKRLNLFLRWMVRSDDIDLGLWKSVDKAKLIIPLDVHLTRLTGRMGFHNRRNVSLKTAVEITGRFAQIEPADPVKYDFTLCSLAILAHCTGSPGPQCRTCKLFDLCYKGKGKRRIVETKSKAGKQKLCAATEKR